MKTIQYYTKNVYGNELIYIADQRQAVLWQGISGRKTIDSKDMDRITELFDTKFERIFEPTK